MSDHGNLIWRDPDGERPNVIRYDRRGPVPDRRTETIPGAPDVRVSELVTRREEAAITLERALRIVWAQLDAGKLDAAAGIHQLTAIERELEDLGRDVVVIYKRISTLEAHMVERINDQEEADNELRAARRRIGNLERHAAEIDALGIPGAPEAGPAAPEPTATATGDPYELAERVSYLERELERTGRHGSRWAGAAWGPVSAREGGAPTVDLRELVRHLEAELASAFPDESEPPPPPPPDLGAPLRTRAERRGGERRRKPYWCEHGCGEGEMEPHGSASIGARILRCRECGEVDRRSAVDRRGAPAPDVCALEGCSAETRNPLWEGWRWARTAEDDPELGGWLCPDHRDQSIPGELRRCAVCSRWTPAVLLVAHPTIENGTCEPCAVAAVDDEISEKVARHVDDDLDDRMSDADRAELDAHG